MGWSWAGFAIFLVLMIAGTFGLKMSWNLRIRYWIFAGVADAFYISIVYQNLICQFIFGGLTLSILFTNLSLNFVQANRQLIVKRVELVLDLLIGVGITIYLIYIIPNKELQQIVIPIVAAVYGGLLTVVSVALTIKNTEKTRQEDEVKRMKPVVFIYDYMNLNDKEDYIRRVMFSKQNFGTLKKTDKKGKPYSISCFMLSNSDYSHCVIRGFRVNDDFHLYDIGQVMRKDSLISFESSYLGIEKEIILTRNEVCNVCHGNKAKPGTNAETCSMCQGTGTIRQVQTTILGQMQTQRTCTNCHGTGKVIKEPCDNCKRKRNNKKTSKIKNKNTSRYRRWSNNGVKRRRRAR